MSKYTDITAHPLQRKNPELARQVDAATPRFCEFPRNGRACKHSAVAWMSHPDAVSGWACDEHARQMAACGWIARSGPIDFEV